MASNQRVKQSALLPLRVKMMVLVFLGVVLTPPFALAYDFQDCEGCHDSSLGEDSGREYLHAPFKEKACGECHAAKVAEEFTEAELKELQKITWLGQARTPATSHSFLLAGSKLREVLVVDVKGVDGGFTRQEVGIPTLADLAEVEDNGKAPAISALQVLEVKHGVLISAIIGWQTDTVADAMVRYGEQELSLTSGSDLRLGRHHQVVLSNLQANRTYRFSAESRDLFGRSQISDPMNFSTAEFVEASPTVKTGDQPGDGDSGGFVCDFKRFGTDYLLEVTTARPVLAYIGTKGKIREQGIADDEFHKDLSSQTVTSLKACLNCHKAHLHPLNVAPTKPGIVIPAEFPTLPGGRITCSSCHEPHGSDFYFHLRKPEQELCASCHPKWVKEERSNFKPH